MRDDEGRPSDGMRPKVINSKGGAISEAVILLILRNKPEESTEFFMFQVQKHNDPQDVYKKGLTYLQATHYHRANEFDDEMTALFAPGSELAEVLIAAKTCTLEFAQFNQKYNIPCDVRLLEKLESTWNATLWHNRLFTPGISDDVEIVGFKPDWKKAVELLG